MEAKVQSVEGTKVINHRYTVDPETWVPNKINFLKEFYSFDLCIVERNDDKITISCHRNRKPRMKEMDITFILTIIH